MADFAGGAIAAWLLGAFFVVGGVVNMFPPDSLRKEYAHWGYPGWFHYVTACLEFASAGLLLFPASRFAGAALGALVMTAAFGTLIRKKEYAHALIPAVVLVFAALIGNTSLN